MRSWWCKYRLPAFVMSYGSTDFCSSDYTDNYNKETRKKQVILIYKDEVN